MVVRLRGNDVYPVVTGLVATIRGRRVPVPATLIDAIEPRGVVLLGRRLIDVDSGAGPHP